METKIKIPTELSEISLGDYQRFVDVSEKSNDDTFIFEKMVEIFCNIQLMEVIQIKWTDVQHIAGRISQAFQKKPEFGPAKIIVTNAIGGAVNYKNLIDNGSLLINKKGDMADTIVGGVNINVDSLYLEFK